MSEVSGHRIYTLWASLKGEEPCPWMLAAEDEAAWEGNPERCEAAFAAAKQLADHNDWEVREITLYASYDALAAPFDPAEVQVAS